MIFTRDQADIIKYNLTKYFTKHWYFKKNAHYDIHLKQKQTVLLGSRYVLVHFNQTGQN